MRYNTFTSPGCVLLWAVLLSAGCGESGGPLKVHPTNPRYFSDVAGEIVYLTGSHNWYNFQDRGFGVLEEVGFENYLDFLKKYGHNFARIWAWENAAWTPGTVDTIRIAPLPYRRTGPGIARDGLPKFDLTKFNPDYFRRLRSRIIAAGDRGVYTMVMLFEGWSIEKKRRQVGNPWNGHPFHRDNNLNGIDGDRDGDSEGHEVHTLVVPAVTELQEAYVIKVIDTLNDLDNVLFEISNESHGESIPWHYHMIDFIHEYESSQPKQHPVVMTVPWPDGDNATLFASPAEAISPNSGVDGTLRKAFPPADGRKVVILDTDHLWGLGGNEKWVWMAFTRGYNPIFMDTMEEVFGANNWDVFPGGPEVAEAMRTSMGQTREFAERMNLTTTIPRGDLASSGYCLADPEIGEYLAYLPEGGTVVVNLRETHGPLVTEWFNPGSGETIRGAEVSGGG
ncbi:DUF6298 domain-containing protein [candidate division KSB1 bacterium]